MNTRVENYAADTAEGATLESLLRQVRGWARREALKYQLKRERRQLTEMSDRMLRDLGISREDALAEAANTDIPAERMTFESRR